MTCVLPFVLPHKVSSKRETARNLCYWVEAKRAGEGGEGMERRWDCGIHLQEEVIKLSLKGAAECFYLFFPEP